MSRARLAVLLVAAGLAVVVVGWLALRPPEDTAAGGDIPAGAATGRVTVLAAASLAAPFEALADRLEAEHPGLEVSLSLGPSSGLAEQALAGAPADVLATADIQTMDVAVEGEVVSGQPEVFARNTPALVVPAGNPGHVQGLADVSRDELRIALCAPEVPCGVVAQQVLDAAGVVASPDTLAADVKEALALVTLGEADAAMVYRTDAVAAGDAVETISLAEAESAVNEYVIASLSSAPNPGAADAFVDAVLGEDGRAVLGEAGFLLP